VKEATRRGSKQRLGLIFVAGDVLLKPMATATLPQLKAKRFWTGDELLAELPGTNLPTELWDGEIITSPISFTGLRA
jgi:hypothetical protein